MQNLLDMKKILVALTFLALSSGIAIGALYPTSALADNHETSSPGFAERVGGAIVDAVKDAVVNTGGELIGGALHGITWVLVKIMTFFLLLVGTFLNVVVEQLVVNMGHFVTSSDAVGIQIAWRIMRDLANLAIIGGLIATAIGTILHLATINAQKLLVRLIIAALLVNFSFFFAGAIIDSSNFLATTIYKATISTESCGENCTIIDRFDKIIKTNNHNIAAYLNEEKIDGIQQDSQWMAVLQNILTIVTIGITIFIFLSATALLLGRFVALILILISSPIGIAGLAIPQINKYAKEWWEALFSQAFFAPVYFLLLGFSFTILENSSGAFSGDNPNLIGTILTFMVAAIFMFQSLAVAKGISESSKRLSSIYKASNAATGWMPKAYIGGVKAVGNLAGTLAIGLPADKLSRGYEKWIAKDGPLQKVFAGTGLDRGIQKGINKVADAKFGGEGYQTKLKEKEERRARLADVNKSRGNLEKSTKKGGLADENNSAEERRAKTEADSIDLDNKLNASSRKKYKKDFSELTDEQKAEVMQDLANDKAFKESDNGKKLDKLTTDDEKYKGKSWADLKMEEREELLKRASADGRWTGKKLLRDKDGHLQIEDSWDYKDRLQTKIDLSTDEEKKAGKGPIIYQATLDKLRSTVGEVSMAQLKEEIRRNPKLLGKIANGLSENQRSALMQDDAISRKDKNAIRMARIGGVMKEAQAFEKRVVSIEDALKMAPDELEGRVIRGSKEYDEYRGKLHQTFKKYYQDAEVIDFFESDAGLQTQARDNKVLIDAVKNAVGKGLQDSTKLSYGEKRRMRAHKRMRITGAEEINDSANEIFEGYGDEYNFESAKDNPKFMSEVIDEVTGGPISFQEFSSKYAEKASVEGGEKDAALFKARWLRAFARAQSDAYFEGKAPGEVDSELKQEAFGFEMVGKHMRIRQLEASQKDQKWKDKQAQAMAIYGTKETVSWFKHTPNGQEYAVNWEKVDEERAKLGLPSTKKLLEEN